MPIHASHEILPSVRMLPVANPMTAATATKMAVQAPCTDTALNAVDILDIPEAATQIHPMNILVLYSHRRRTFLTEHEGDPHELFTSLSA
jgi:hypothetical protein